MKVLHLFMFQIQDESSHPDKEPDEDEWEGARDGDSGHQELMASGV